MSDTSRLLDVDTISNLIRYFSFFVLLRTFSTFFFCESPFPHDLLLPSFPLPSPAILAPVHPSLHFICIFPSSLPSTICSCALSRSFLILTSFSCSPTFLAPFLSFSFFTSALVSSVILHFVSLFSHRKGNSAGSHHRPNSPSPPFSLHCLVPPII